MLDPRNEEQSMPDASHLDVVIAGAEETIGERLRSEVHEVDEATYARVLSSRHLHVCDVERRPIVVRDDGEHRVLERGKRFAHGHAETSAVHDAAAAHSFAFVMSTQSSIRPQRAAVHPAV